jgi:microcystin-dependent protein
MSQPFLSEIRIFSFNYAPKGWALCNGQILPISQNQALFSLLGTMYGGDGQSNFALPNLQGCVATHLGNGFGQGQSGGEQAHTLSLSELPKHSHPVNASTNTADQTYPPGNLWAAGGRGAAFHPVSNATMNANTVAATGGNAPHNNMAPFLVLIFCIALQGVFPSRN